MTIFTYALLIFLIFIYLFLCRYLRFRRLKSILLKYNHVQLDYRQAQDIVRVSTVFEMPYTINKSLNFALFRTYGIPTISRLLVHTNQLVQSDLVGRRAEDTTVLMSECLLHELDSYRARMSLARINYLHSLYRNRISNDDMLYTLSLFILEPIRWIEKYEWRLLNSIEEQARFFYYKELGIRMGIEDIPLTLNDLEKWANDYEDKNMIYSKDNQLCGEATLALMLVQFPQWMQSFVRQVSLSLVDERLRISMGFEKVSIWMKYLTIFVLNIRAFLLCHCTLPRIYPEDYGQSPTSCPLNKYGRYQRTNYLFEPWYVMETWWNRIFPFSGKKPGLEYRSQGFKVEELGPEKFAGQGLDAMEKDAEKMKERTI
jgi:hypothetical protein